MYTNNNWPAAACGADGKKPRQVLGDRRGEVARTDIPAVRAGGKLVKVLEQLFA